MKKSVQCRSIPQRCHDVSIWNVKLNLTKDSNGDSNYLDANVSKFNPNPPSQIIPDGFCQEGVDLLQPKNGSFSNFSKSEKDPPNHYEKKACHSRVLWKAPCTLLIKPM